MLTARGDDVDRIVGLELGADDYLSKPFNPRELVARIRAILRRASNRNARGAAADVFESGRSCSTPACTRCASPAKPVPLTGAEFRVLELLMRSAGQVISREALTEQALGRKLVPTIAASTRTSATCAASSASRRQDTRRSRTSAAPAIR
jgi:DNA-binding response OmpR family regulator